MTKWNEGVSKVRNDSPVLETFLEKINATFINHYELAFFGDPVDEEFLEQITVATHIFSVGDKLSKIAFEYYGDAKLWWVLAWFNDKPTDFDCKIGDIIRIPEPLKEVLHQAYKRDQE